MSVITCTTRLQEKLLQLELQHSNLQELMASLKDSKSTAAKLTEWHAKLGEMRLQEMKLSRALERERGRVKHLEWFKQSSSECHHKVVILPCSVICNHLLEFARICLAVL